MKMESQRRCLLLGKWRMIATSLLLLFHGSHCFLFPVLTPRNFRKGDLLKVEVNELTSRGTLVPYSYYSLPYCRPTNKTGSSEIHSEELHDYPVESSPYMFKMWEPETCKVLCRFIIDAKSANEIKEKIYYQYRVNMILDDLPLVFPIHLIDNEDSPNSYHLELGFPVGLRGWYATTEEGIYFINNHLAFTVDYHRDMETDSARIVGFEVKPFSIKHRYKGKWNENTRLLTCGKERASYLEGPQEVEGEKEIIFTYDVQFQETDLKWASRWDAYLLTRHRKTQWLSIISSLTIVLLLSGMVAMLTLRTLYCDIAKYEETESQEEAVEKTGWKLVHADVFRPPSNSDLLCVCVGTGVHVFGTVLAILILAIFGILSPPNGGLLARAMLILWVLMGLFGGYAASRLHKTFKGTRWKIIALKTTFMFPVLGFAILLVLNHLLWSQNSSRAVPFGKMFTLAFLLLGISVPLVFIGSFFGFKKPVIEDPVKTYSIPRPIPKRAWYMNPVFSILIGGILPFGTVFNEVFFILASICLNQLIYIYGFLLVFVILVIVCGELTIVFCYFHLCRENPLYAMVVEILPDLRLLGIVYLPLFYVLLHAS